MRKKKMGGTKRKEKVEKTEKTEEKQPKSGDNLTVGVRIRPLRADEASKGFYNIVETLDKNKVELREPELNKDDHLRKNRFKDKVFEYDVSFGQDSTQEDVYTSTTKSLVDDVLNGFTATVFAYGPTGAGKTFTMVGTEEKKGIMVRALNDIFKAMDARDSKTDFKISMSYLEIYNENIRDLLKPNSGTLQLREDAKSGVIQVAGLSTTSTTSTNDVLQLLTRGNKVRTCESTAVNKTSSRSHAMLQVMVKQTKQNDEKANVKIGKLYMIDLAGSERAKKTKNEGKRLQEGAFINKSLLALGNCINALAEGKAKYVNYRDSKLTRLLKDALSGNCRTVMLAHVSPPNIYREETRSTLIYADKAKNISNKTKRNVLDVSYHVSQYQAIIGELKGEITRLNSKLSNPDTSEKKSVKNDDRTNKIKDEMKNTFKEQMNLRSKLMEIDTSLLALSMEFERQNQVVQEWESERIRRSFKPPNEITVDDTDSEDDEEEPDEVSQAWEDLVYLQKEQERYAQMRIQIMEEMEEVKERARELEEDLPNMISTDDEKDLLHLMCKCHELQIKEMEMKSDAVLKEHELHRRDLMILRYDRQKALSEEIILRQRQHLEAIQSGDTKAANPSMPPELNELYSMYQQELHYNTNDRDNRYLSDLNSIYRSTSVLSLRNISSEHLPPIDREPEKLFRRRRHSAGSMERSSSPTLSLNSSISSASTTRSDILPPIDRNRSNSLIGIDGSVIPMLSQYPSGRSTPRSSPGSSVRPRYRDYYPQLAMKYGSKADESRSGSLPPI